MKNKVYRKVLSALLALMLTLLPLSHSVFTQEAKAAVKNLQEIQTMFPEGKYWNHVAKISGLDGKELSAGRLVGSGMTLVFADGTKHTVIIKGDGDSDGKITAADARLALRQAVGLDKNPAWFIKACNVDGEKQIEAADARLILRASVGLEKF